MTSPADRFIVITGGPGSGKTSLVEHLAASGHQTSDEAGRAIIQAQQQIGGTALPWADRQLFAELMLSWEIRSHQAALTGEGPVVFDRGVPDVIGYLTLCGLPVPAHMQRAAALHRYADPVFIAPFWPEIFRQDAERHQDLAEAERTHAAMVEAYRAAGYRLMELPRAPVAERAEFVVETVGNLLRPPSSAPLR
ncbi:AAA family ATPase [Amorphus orientalis]|uniref:ATPase n=1 Tax=Amorphus orientalis TaxID=649198 RepID=A0AAE3VS51_9HYPH|nr:AAA family ATPase [Amorphus orientalis]MDQ0317146.1 putative ATPase [Amorphus orientalis]